MLHYETVTVAGGVGCSAVGPTRSPLQDDRRLQLSSEPLHLLGPSPTAAIPVWCCQRCGYTVDECGCDEGYLWPEAKPVRGDQNQRSKQLAKQEVAQ
jgi:hypothetical protein